MPIIAPGARPLIERHQLDGDLCIIITATNSFVTAPIAQLLGIEHLIATEPEQEKGEFTGKVTGIPSFREGKIDRLEQWLDVHNLTWLSFLRSWFYSDSLNDLPLLGKVTHPVAVDPDATLKIMPNKITGLLSVCANTFKVTLANVVNLLFATAEIK